MIELIWISLLILFSCVTSILLVTLFRQRNENPSIKVFMNGFWDGLRGSGWWMASRRPAEKYRWAIVSDGDICQECLEKSEWPAMDIADWMEKGLPYPPDELAPCGGECRCKLVLERSDVTHPQNNH